MTEFKFTAFFHSLDLYSTGPWFAYLQFKMYVIFKFYACSLRIALNSVVVMIAHIEVFGTRIEARGPIEF